MTLVADRFIRYDDGTVRDLATGELVTLVEMTVTDVAEQLVLRDCCLARLGAGCDSEAGRESVAPRLLDFALVGESRWIEAYAPGPVACAADTGDADTGDADTSDTGTSDTDPGDARASVARSVVRRVAGSSETIVGPIAGTIVIAPALDAICATLDGLGSHDVRRLYVKAPDAARLATFHAIVAREIRARGFIPLSPLVVAASPDIARLLAGRSIVLLGDARCGFNGFSGLGDLSDPSSFDACGSFGTYGACGESFDAIARAIVLLRRAACSIGAIVARICNHVNVAALHLLSSSSSPSKWAPQNRAPHNRAPLSVVQPARPISYADPDLPPLFPRTFQLARVAETAWAYEAYDEQADEALPSMSLIHPEDIIVTTDGDAVDRTTGEVSSEGNPPRSLESARESTGVRHVEHVEQGRREPAAAMRYPPLRRRPSLRLVERRVRSEPLRPAEDDGACDVPVVTTMVSGYGAVAEELVARGRWAAASRALRGELAAYERRKHRRAAARTSIALGRLHLAMGEVGPATRWFNHAEELASASGAKAAEWGGADGMTVHSGAALIGEALRWSGIAALEDADLEQSERLLRCALAAIGPEADRNQAIAIELSLARCLFWQGRAREIVLPSNEELLGSEARLGSGRSAHDTQLTSEALSAREPRGALPHTRSAAACDGGGVNVILRVERWRRAARLALADGDLSRAGDAIARACRLARGDDEEDVRSGGCRIEDRARAEVRKRAGSRAGAAAAAAAAAGGRGEFATGDDARIREALRAACHLDAARLQFAIGDTATGDAHLRASLALSRVPARIARVQLLQLARLRADRTSEGRRRFERLSTALRQPRMSRLVRIQARYLIDPRSRRATELVTFLNRHGDAALAGHDRDRADRRGGSPMLEGFQDVLRICHETPDDRTALARVCAYLRDRLRAVSAAIYGTADDGGRVGAGANGGAPRDEGRVGPGIHAAAPVRFALAGSMRMVSPELATRAIDSGLLIPPTYRADALDMAAPVRYGGAPIGAVVVRWSIDTTLDHTHASALVGAAAAAVSPHLRAALDRERPTETGAASIVAIGPSASSASSASGASRGTLGLLGISDAIEALRQTITRVSSAPFHVLIEGESGSGKELVARALHQHGPRRHRRFCAVNCAALTDELLEAELFGHTRGAFTGALTERAGLFEEADDGTLFLDEIGELSPRGQAKLLRVIQDGETRRIGENVPRRVDTRIVAATNRVLRDEADAGRFRADLLYRLDVIRIAVPPLRARPEDVPVLARAFWEQAVARLGSRATLDPATLIALARYHWPGNVRELHNAMMALAVHAPPRGRVTPSMLPATFRERRADAAAAGAESAGGHATGGEAGREPSSREPLSEFEGSLEDAKRAFEARYVRAALARAGGSPSRAARSLGLTRQGLAKLIARLGLADGCKTRPAAGRKVGA